MEQRRSKNSTSSSTKKVQSRQRTRKPSEPMSRDEVRRYNNIQRKKRRRRNKIILYCVMIVIITAVAIALSLTVFFKIQSVNVVGDDVYASESIISASELTVGENMFRYSKREISEKIEKTLPYVESVTVKRSPTGKITLEITAAKAEFAIDCGETYTLLSRSCKVLEDGIMFINDDVSTVSTSAVVYSEVGETAQFENSSDKETLSEIKKVFEDNSIEKITHIDITDYSSVEFVYDMRITLEIGMVSNLKEKADFISATLSKINADEPSFEGTIDFTVENKAFINEKEETTLPIKNQSDAEQTTDSTPDAA